MGTISGKPVVLIVDDEKQIREVGRTFFETLGYTTVSASTYDAAVKAIHDDKNGHSLMVAFIDIHLRSASGIELLRYIKRTAAHRVVPYVFTGSDSLTVEIEAKKAGAFEVFRKSGAGTDWDRLAICVNPEESPVLNLLQNFALDDLTGIDNFREFRKRALSLMRTAKDRRSPAVLSLLSIDVDYFKTVNDTHGHLVGDDALKTIAVTLREHVRPSDCLCRKSGDEFLLLLSDVDVSGANEVGKKLQKAVTEKTLTNREGTRRIPLAISFGVSEVRHSEIEEPEETLDRLIDHADTAEGGLIAKRREERK